MSGALLCMLVVILGAFGAHGLKAIVSQRSLEVYQTGVLYQMFHSLGILIVGILTVLDFQRSQKYLKLSYRFFLLGIFLFCGSLYGLAISEAVTGERINQLGIVTPFGGLSFVAGWLSMFLALWKQT
jgi:uncharacterized membrane protein YgdD (TMEM256/DUF423 family)